MYGLQTKEKMAKVNKEKEALLSQERLKEVLKYNPNTGDFVWLVSRTNRVKVGQVAGYLSKGDGYISIGVDGYYYKAHRLVWLYVYGYFPKGRKPLIDHRDGNKTNNRLKNLGEVSAAENQRNLKLSAKNTSGATGIIRVGLPNGSKTKINYYWIASWYDENGKERVKYFSIRKLGEEQAKQLATTHRGERIRLLEVTHNIKYSPRHGFNK